MITLQTIKDKLAEVELSLPEGKKLEDIPLHVGFQEECRGVEIDTFDYLGHTFAKIEIE